MKSAFEAFFLGCIVYVVGCQSSATGDIEKTQMLWTEALQDSKLESRFVTAIQNIKPDPKQIGSIQGMRLISGGNFQMGGDFPDNQTDRPQTALPQPDEFPKHQRKVESFYMDSHEVTRSEFEDFIQATGYKTVAEYDLDWKAMQEQLPVGTPKPHDSLLKAGALTFDYAARSSDRSQPYYWWTFTRGVFWKNPSISSVAIDQPKLHPVTQVSWYDAMAYARWVGKRLPTEVEYEYAMRGGQKNSMYPWGNALPESGTYGNFFQGNFPYHDRGTDGYTRTAPVGTFPPNSFGLYDIAGNVWEWTLDWYQVPFPNKASTVSGLNNGIDKVVRGGSFLCSDSWCSGYRNARRMRLTPDTGMEHLGFRLVRDCDPKTQE